MPLLSLHFVPTEVCLERYILLKYFQIYKKLQGQHRESLHIHTQFSLASLSLTVLHYMVFVTINEPISPLNHQTSFFFFFGKNFNFDFSLIKWNLFFVLKVTIENIKIPVASESSIWAKKFEEKSENSLPKFQPSRQDKSFRILRIIRQLKNGNWVELEKYMYWRGKSNKMLRVAPLLFLFIFFGHLFKNIEKPWESQILFCFLCAYIAVVTP